MTAPTMAAHTALRTRDTEAGAGDARDTRHTRDRRLRGIILIQLLDASPKVYRELKYLKTA